MSAERAGGFRIAQADNCDLEVEMTNATRNLNSVDDKLKAIQKMAEGLKYSLARTPSPAPLRAK